jgi:hypothetical protein
LTLEWRPRRGGSRSRRGKGRYERPAPLRREIRRLRRSLEALILGPGKTALGEQRGGTSGAPEREAQCRACRWWARLEIGSLGTFSLSVEGRSCPVPPYKRCRWEGEYLFATLASGIDQVFPAVAHSQDSEPVPSHSGVCLRASQLRRKRAKPSSSRCVRETLRSYLLGLSSTGTRLRPVSHAATV